MLHVIDKTWSPSTRETAAGIGYGFGTTINIINGGIECGEQNKTKGQPVNRIRYWEGLSSHYQIPIEMDEENTCWQQTPYGSLNLEGATDVLYTNWEGDWAYYADRPEGYAFECKLVGYQTAYSALVPGDYEKCVTNFYQSHANWPAVRLVDKLPNPVEPPATGNEWSATKVYNKDERVVYLNNEYQAQWWTQGDVPTDGGPWQLVSDNTNPPADPPADPPVTTNGWQADKVYLKGETAIYNGVKYTSQWWNQGEQPDISNAWK